MNLLQEHGEELAFLQAKQMNRLFSSRMAIDLNGVSDFIHGRYWLVTNVSSGSAETFI